MTQMGQFHVTQVGKIMGHRQDSHMIQMKQLMQHNRTVSCKTARTVSCNSDGTVM